MKPFFCYFGGKWRSASKYPAPNHPTIIEPFAGAAGYSTRHSRRNVILYDIDEKVCGVWDYLIRASETEINQLPSVVNHVSELSVCQEAKWLIGFWLHKGNHNPSLRPDVWMRSGTRPNAFWGSYIRSRIAYQVGRIKHWKIIHGTYEDVENTKATWFIDPPYQGPAGRVYRFNKIDFCHLRGWCRDRNGQVIVCELSGADWLPFRDLAIIQAKPGKEGHRTSSEAIWECGDMGLSQATMF